ncbi:MAG: class I SAM-dependent methyltransferase [Candidatus Omnitrophota bacterium]|nr:class I SAM-dependent methyltransferase [Candidatus Omnitrophota bacterium]
MENTACNICGGKVLLPVFSSGSFMYPDKTFSLVECAGCGLVFLNPRPDRDEIGKYYAGYHLHIDISGLSRLSKRILLVEAIGSTKYETSHNRDKFLEIGFGDGLFLEYMRNKNWDVYGIEIEEECVNRMKKLGFENVYAGGVFRKSFDEASFDLVRLNQALEHMHDPLQVLQEIKRILKVGGKLVISVPNFNGACHRFFREHAYPLHLPFHLYFFSLSTLQKLIEKAGGLKITKSHKNHSFVLYLASLVQFLKRDNKNNPSYRFSDAKLIIHRLIGIIALPFMNLLNLFVEGDNLEVEIIKV